MSRADAPETADSTTRTLDRRLFGGIAWIAVWRWAAQLFSWGMTFYAARILTPGDYGLASMCAMPIGLARMVENLGLDAVIVQDRELSEGQIADLGGLAFVIGFLLWAAFSAASWSIAAFFHEPAVAAMVVVLALTFITDAAQILPRALLQRDLAFARLAWINAAQIGVTATTLATCASLGLSHWSLVLNTLCGGIAVSLLLWYSRPHRLGWPRSLRHLTRSVTNGGQVLASRIAWYGYSTSDQTLIGRMIGKDALGAYSFAMTFASIPLEEVTSLVGKVVPGVFSAVQHDVAQLKRYYLMLSEMLACLTFPVAIGTALVADDFIKLALGPKWLAVIDPLRILAVYAAITSAQSLIGHVLLWTGRFRINLYLNIFALIILPPAFYVGTRWGIAGVAWAMVIVFPISVIPGFVVVGRVLRMPIWEWVRALVPALASCAAMVVVVLLLRAGLRDVGVVWMRFGLQASIGALVYIGVLWLGFRGRVERAVAIIRGRGVEA